MYIETIDSTNNGLKRLMVGEAPELAPCLEEELPILWTRWQSAGRGQSGNGWESAQGQNLLMSVLLRQPDVPVDETWRLTVMVGVALWRTVAEELEDPARLTLKWPNDLYYGDKKLSGTLVETALQGERIDWAVAGIGLNLHQTKWDDNVPNPVSLKQITGKDYDAETMQARFVLRLKEVLKTPYDMVLWDYEKVLYRRDGWWPYVLRPVDSRPTMNATKTEVGAFRARFRGVSAKGFLQLEDNSGQVKQYHFKEIRYVIG